MITFFRSNCSQGIIAFG